ncbi:molybdopterin molybdochelatase [Glaciihabitans tibetensis]|uniref:Molybdopterin molybdenumtransferase n=1 Tax=Glaciihabitans tibetensis TaxID=1266600 RepID=A0A2T0VFQ7_9MICO|nr:gephyrin-like molybdotransferase Glp [Glaciihabitans tibetensis]PRY69040.1 molybdopterin molybdochelatase [Glaciihabitans tibetensis]
MNAHPHDQADTSVDQHAELILDLLTPTLGTLGSEQVPLADALGRVTAAPVLSPVDLPLFRNSQMDGFAVHAEDLASIPATLPIVGEVAARPGTPARLLPGTAVRIMTGAVVPDGANTVVPVEDTSVTLFTDAETVTIGRARAVGEYVRNRGSDAHAGDTLLPAGIRLGSRHLAVLAAAGITDIEVKRRLRVAVITTGAELIAPGEHALPGQVYDANGIALVAAIISAGAVVATTHRVVDDPEAMLVALEWAASTADLIVTSGGISMGDHEVVREVLGPLGAHVGHIAMQPGGPQATGEFQGVPVLGFPGNPVSTQISFEVFLAPILRALAGLPAAARHRRALSAALRSVPGKRQFLRGRIRADGRVEVVAGPGSHLVAGLAASDVLLDVPAHVIELNEGDLVETVDL